MHVAYGVCSIIRANLTESSLLWQIGRSAARKDLEPFFAKRWLLEKLGPRIWESRKEINDIDVDVEEWEEYAHDLGKFDMFSTTEATQALNFVYEERHSLQKLYPSIYRRFPQHECRTFLGNQVNCLYRTGTLRTKNYLLVQYKIVQCN